MSLFSRTSLAVALILVAAAMAAVSGASAAGVHAARSCGSYRKGSVYILGLHTRHVSCRTGKRVANAFTNCRHRHGRSGHCHHRVRHFKCHEGSRVHGQGQYNAHVSCRRGGKRVRFSYSQNT
jgi:hypothetical protein